MSNLLNKIKNVVSTDILQYSNILTGVTGIGKTSTLNEILSKASPEGKDPLFLMFEDRYQHIDNIWAEKINSVDDLEDIISQLQNPAVKEICSCVVIDTIDKYEEMMEDYVEKSKNVEILKDVGGFGEGTQRFRTKLRYIQKIRNLGYPVWYAAQSVVSTDITNKANPNLRIHSLKLNKNTLSYVSEGVAMIGYLFAEGDKRYLTFENSYNNQTAFGNNDVISYLKKSFKLPVKIDINEYNDVIVNTIKKNFKTTTDKNTLEPKVDKIPFSDLKSKGLSLGKLLCSKGLTNEVTSIIDLNLGKDDNGHSINFNTVVENQYDVVKVIVRQMSELANKNNIDIPNED